MKKAIETLLGLGCLTCLVLAGAENPDGSCNIIWTLSFLAGAILFGLAFGKMNEKSTLKK